MIITKNPTPAKLCWAKSWSRV